MSKNALSLKARPHSRKSPISRMAVRARRGEATWGDRIVRLLCREDATARTLARRLGCQVGDISRAIEALRKAEIILDSGIGPDPDTGCRAHFWAVQPELAGFADEFPDGVSVAEAMPLHV